jgi:hypothetical protein
MRNSLSLSFAAVAALLAAGAAYAQTETPAQARGEPRGPTTRAEAEQRSTQVFGRMDANSDGVLNQADREAARRQAFDSVDTDKDGTISLDERRDARHHMRHDRRRGGPPARDAG